MAELMSHDLEELLEKVKSAKGPDEALDVAIATALAPDVIVDIKEDGGTVKPYTYWEYTASVEAVVELMKRQLSGSNWVLRRAPGRYVAGVRGGSATTAPTPALALLALALSLIIQQQKGILPVEEENGKLPESA